MRTHSRSAIRVSPTSAAYWRASTCCATGWPWCSCSSASRWSGSTRPSAASSRSASRWPSSPRCWSVPSSPPCSSDPERSRASRRRGPRSPPRGRVATMRIQYRVGVMPGPWPVGPAGRDFFWRFVELCEKSEIDSLWFSERLSSPLPIPEPMTAMAAIAARTTRLKFGPSVFVTPFRSPVLAAREIAMIDYLSGGRLLPAFGIGAEQEREFLAAGVPFRERGRRTDEAIAILRRCWTEDEVTFARELWRLDRITVLPKPVQQPLELWIGGNSEAAMRRAGRLGDGGVPAVLTPQEITR